MPEFLLFVYDWLHMRFKLEHLENLDPVIYERAALAIERRIESYGCTALRNAVGWNSGIHEYYIGPMRARHYLDPWWCQNSLSDYGRSHRIDALYDLAIECAAAHPQPQTAKDWQ